MLCVCECVEVQGRGGAVPDQHEDEKTGQAYTFTMNLTHDK